MIKFQTVKIMRKKFLPLKPRAWLCFCTFERILFSTLDLSDLNRSGIKQHNQDSIDRIVARIKEAPTATATVILEYEQNDSGYR